jgi:hypothetical protein
MRRFGKTFEEGARRGTLAGLYALITFMDSFGEIRCWLTMIGRGWKRDLCRALSILGLSLGSSYAGLREGESLTVLFQGLPYWIPHCVEYGAD